jgi:ribosome-binding protein aMBF1 (putative translation factor)
LLLPPRNPGARKVALGNVRRLNADSRWDVGATGPLHAGTSRGEVSVADLFSSLRQARLLHGLSLDEVASTIMVSGGHVSRLERGFAVLTPDLARRFSKLYKIKIRPSPVAMPSRARRTTLTQSRRPGRRP